MATPTNILVAVDFSDSSAHALRYAKELAKPLNAKLHLVHVIPDPSTDPWLPVATKIDPEVLRRSWEEEAQRRLRQIEPDDVPTESAVQVGRPASGITGYAAEHAIDLIVVGTHGPGALEHALLGSVAERVIRNATCPVLTVR